jgi:hypothetical protein
MHTAVTCKETSIALFVGIIDYLGELAPDCSAILMASDTGTLNL